MGNASRKVEAPPLTSEVPPVEAEEVIEGYLDPRSPTPDVARTPISGKDGVQHKITKNVDLNKTLEEYQPEEKMINNNPILSAVIRNHLQMYDPRSPTQEFERTPIVLAPNGMRNNTDGVLNGSVAFDSDCDDKNAMDPDVVSDSVNREIVSDTTFDSTVSDPEPLGSSTASQDAIEKETSETSAKILLETNFDYTPRAEDTENTATEVGTPAPISLPDKIKNKLKSTEDPRSPSQGIERTPIVLPQKETVSVTEEVEDMTEESLIAALQNGISDLRRTPVQPGNKNGLLIYEDDMGAAVVKTPLSTQSATRNARTPLSCMKNKTEERPKSDAFVEAKKKAVSRIPKRISHIPRIQKSITVDVANTKIEHENNPPVSSHVVWDRESSVVL